MSEHDVIKNFAEQCLTIATLTGSIDKSLWDRTGRLVKNVNCICELPEIVGTDVQVDRSCLLTATYFCETGHARYLQKHGSISNGNGNRSILLEASTEIVNQKLRAIMDKPKVDKINKIIVESGNRFTHLIEAMILSDARNLDDMGALGLFNEFRHHGVTGKSVSDALQSWDRKIDYQYWQARLKESFRFEAVRQAAKKRLSTADKFMKQLKTETQAGELEGLSVN